MGRCIEKSVEITVEIKNRRMITPTFPIESLVLEKRTFFVQRMRIAKTRRFIKRSFDKSVLLAILRSYQKGRIKRRADKRISDRLYFM